MLLIFYRTVDGESYWATTVADWDSAIAYLQKVAAECLASHHRVVDLDTEQGVLRTSYAGDDMVVWFIIEEMEA